MVAICKIAPWKHRFVIQMPFIQEINISFITVVPCGQDNNSKILKGEKSVKI